MNFWTVALGAVATLFTIAMLFTAGWDRPPIETEQVGYRGVAMGTVANPREAAELEAANQVPPPPYEIEDLPGPTAGEFYENVQVLGDISADRFNRLMAAMTEWVAPQEEGCAYCHNLENMADDSKYQHKVTRRMIQMTQHINADWQDHVGAVGVTCYTCHRGQPVPEYIWFDESGPKQASGMAANRQGQNVASRDVGTTSLPYNALMAYLSGDESIRVHSPTALASGTQSNIKDAEKTYAFMVHMSTALGVNCTYCHNSRAFDQWDQSTPARIPAWHGIYMARSLNVNYLEPLQPVYPDYRLGPKGDAPKANCATCHQGVAKPLYGVNMVRDYPSLAAPAQLVDDTSTDESGDESGMDGDADEMEQSSLDTRALDDLPRTASAGR